jgi:peptidoglycan/LPS O-acetylase OafA/YrhL
MSNARIKGLDGLRAIAVALVFITHAWHNVDFGPFGVRLFFVLSGYLITGILIRARDSGYPVFESLRIFYLRRAVRIFPAYFLLLGILVCLNAPTARQYFAWYALYGTNVLIARLGDWLGPYTSPLWSLAVEEQFYLLWPFVVLCTPAKHLKPAIYTMFAASTLYRLVGRFVFHWGYIPTVVSLLGNLDALAIGALLTLSSPTERRNFGGAAPALIVALGVALTLQQFGRGSRPNLMFFETLCTLAAAAVLCKVLEGDWSRPLNHPVLNFIGLISYGIYLYHDPILALMPEHPFLAIPPVLLAAATSWFLLEQPINRLKDRFTYRPAEKVIAA